MMSADSIKKIRVCFKFTHHPFYDRGTDPREDPSPRLKKDQFPSAISIVWDDLIQKIFCSRDTVPYRWYKIKDEPNSCNVFVAIENEL